MVTQSKRVMFVDDEEGVRKSFDRLLWARGFAVSTVEDGERAVSQLREEPAEVVVSDLRMPGLDGLQLLEWIHERQPQTRFILLTGYGNAEVERKARALGAYEYLNKPISPDALSLVITAALNLDRQAEEKARAAADAAEAAAALPVPGATVARAAAAEPVVEARPATAEVIEARPAPVEEEVVGGAKTGLKMAGGLILAPIAGLAFVIFLPVIGFGMLAWVAVEAIRKHTATARA